MRDVEIPLPPEADCDVVERAIELAVSQSGLEINLRGSLKKYPGCIHWHLKTPGSSGTLELTLWPRAHRAWFSIQSGRAAPWIDAAMSRLREMIQQRLNAD